MRKTSVPALAMSIALAAYASAAGAADWPRYRGPRGDGIVTEEGLLAKWPDGGPRKLWSVQVASSNGAHAGAAVSAGKVYVAGRSGDKDQLLCLAADGGKDLWRYEYGSPGNLSWGAGIRATPTVSGGCVYLLSGFNALHCVDAEKGAKLWSRDLVAEFGGQNPKFGAAAAPLIEGELVVCEPGGQGSSIVALKAKTGEEAWRAGDWPPAYAAPQAATICGVRQILVFPRWGVAGLDAASGKVLWSFRLEDQKNAGAPVISADTVIAGNISEGMVCKRIVRDGDAWKAENVWKNAAVKLHTSSPVMDGGRLYFYDLDAKLNCVDAASGELKWSIPAKPQMPKDMDHHASVLLVGAGRLLINYSDGEAALVAVTAEGASDLGRFKAVGGTAFGPAAVADGKLYVRDQRSLACFDVKGE